MNMPLADQEKRWAALTSVVAALGLTGMKIVVGIVTGSLGILAEAAHSGLDLVAALVTYLAVRYSSKPADSSHLYGHGKVENLSALFETLLLLATCVWIIHEAIDRLFVKEVEVSASVWAFLVMAVSIVVDKYRSANLYRVAQKYNSQALEADALHFSTDIWSSCVVILGLGGVKLAQFFPSISFIKHADAVAALGVAIIVIYVSMELLTRSLQGLLDAAPHGAAEKIKKEVEKLPNVIDCHHVRVRYSGSHLFVDIHVLMDGNLTLDEAHEITEQVEDSIQKKFMDADVSVHPEPRGIHKADGRGRARGVIPG
ncbi:MAG: cation diffusion facilitator family transporter [bacterium]